MIRKLLPYIGLVLLSTLPSVALGAESAMTPSWEPQTGDVFVVDVGVNTGYLVHADGRTLSFPVATGRKEYVSYIGRYYKAETPVRTWTAEQFQIKGDRRTFGVSGRFIRLFRNGENSPYGIHSYYKVGEWMEEDQRYFSMGCIVVTENIMDIMEKTFAVNDQKMIVITTNDAQAALQKLTASAASGIKS
ncbi:MAG: L,D-transpeptidase [Candidatus Peribacteraceae bacterium]|nr:L,D-transpeptidase [Candidatus Peribacteraceae bacterium]